MKLLKRWHWMVLKGLIVLAVWSPSAYALTAIEAGQKGLNYVVNGALAWENRNHCYGCHTHGLSVWGAGIGLSKGYTLAPAKLTQLMGAVKAEQQADGKWTHSAGMYPMSSTLFAASGLAFYDRHVSSEAQANFMKAVSWLLPKQQANGQFPTDPQLVGQNNSPSANAVWRGNSIYLTTMGVVAMGRAYALTSDPKYLSARDKAVTWLKGHSIANTQAIAFKLIGLIEGGVPKNDPSVVASRNELLVYQNGDGGFGAYVGWASNAYHTGIAIYALRLSGMLSSDPRINAGIGWLLARQRADGSWPIGSAILGATDPVAPSMWPAIALGEFGELGVTLKSVPLETLIDAFSPNWQTVSYTLEITNSGAKADTYKLDLSGGLPGFGAALSANLIALEPNASSSVTLTVTAPPNLPYGLPLVHTVIATSQSDPDVVATASVKTYTPPPPPVTGHTTTVTFVDGANGTVLSSDSLRFAVRVVDANTNTVAAGPGLGSVSFYVAGIVVGTDDDANGDGIYEFTWNPGWKWGWAGTQSVLAAYSGIDRATGDDLLSSYGLTKVNITVVPPTPGELMNDVISDLQTAQNFFIPPQAPKGVGAKLDSVLTKVNDALIAWQAGDMATALNKIDAATAQLQGTIDQVNGLRCSVKGGKNCINDGEADTLVNMLGTAIDTLLLARALI